MRVQHIVITRYNLSIPSRASWVSELKCLDPVWLDFRLHLFDRFCLPSVANQSRLAFVWIMLLHPSTPIPYVAKLVEVLKASNVRFSIWNRNTNWFLTKTEVPHWKYSIRHLLDARTTHLITTRLDSDDVIHRRFIEGAQDALAGQDASFFEYPMGHCYDLNTKKLFERTWHSNSFITRIERVSQRIETVLCSDHAKVRDLYPSFISDASFPAWMQIIHGENLSNKIVGVECPVNSSEIYQSFGVWL